MPDPGQPSSRGPPRIVEAHQRDSGPEEHGKETTKATVKAEPVQRPQQDHEGRHAQDRTEAMDAPRYVRFTSRHVHIILVLDLHRSSYASSCRLQGARSASH